MTAFCLFVFLANTSLAAGPLVPGAPTAPGGSASSKYETGKYEPDDLLSVFVLLANIILGLVGSATLLMLIYGGVLMIVAGQGVVTKGDTSETVNKGKDAIKGAVIGLVIVLAAALIIQIVLEGIGYTGVGTWRKGFFK